MTAAVIGQNGGSPRTGGKILCSGNFFPHRFAPDPANLKNFQNQKDNGSQEYKQRQKTGEQFRC